jgi:hypothetical protein
VAGWLGEKKEHFMPTRFAPAYKITINEDQDRRDRALEELVKEDHWITEFIKRLNFAIEDIGRKK